MTRPRLLDLFCKAGGAARGYTDAGFEVVGVDITPQPNYPFTFIQADAVECARDLGDGFDAIHASPPCQRFSTMTKRHGTQDEHPDLVDATREALEAIGLPYVIENVAGAPLRDPLLLCGSMFGLGVHFEGAWRYLQRHRLFESNVGFPITPPCAHGEQSVGVYGNPGGSSKRDGIRFPDTAAWKVAMSIDWMTAKEMAEAIPPAYTQFVGLSLMQAVMVRPRVQVAA